MQYKRRVAHQRDGKNTDYSASTGTSSATSASSSLILDTNLASSDPIHSPMTMSEMDDPYSARRRRFRLGSASFEGLVGISETDLTPRAGPQTAGVIGQHSSRTSPTAAFDPFSTEFGHVAREQHRFRERSRGETNTAESPSPRSATFSLFSSESTQNTNTTASSPESSPLKTSKPPLPIAKIAPIGTKRSTGSLTSNESIENGRMTMSAPIAPPLQSPRIATPTATETDKWNVFSGGWGTPFINNDSFHSRSATADSNAQKGIWGNGSKGLGMTVGSGSVDVWG
jgi:hypothetical protein